MKRTRTQGGFDLDGVLARTDQMMIACVQERGLLLGRTADEITHHRLEDAFPGEITQEQLGQIFADRTFWRRINPCRLLIDSLRTCWEEGIDIHIVTARFDWQCEGLQGMTRDWLLNYGIPYRALAFVEAKDKATYVEQHNLEFFVEDRLDTAENIARVKGCDSYLVSMPYNNGGSTADEHTTHIVRRRNRSFFPSLINHVR